MTSYNKVSNELLEKIVAICGADYVSTAADVLREHGRDYTEDLIFYPEVVVRPSSEEEICAIMSICNEHLIPVTPRGAGTGLSGGALPTHGGVVVSTARLNRILEIDERNLQATVEPGVINQIFKDAVSEKGLFYPPDPASRGSCF